ncbi:hypothetical protein [Devosia sp.]|uniref:hypothetical protein n=1 Tax=Devosia sp. TaxID=1871048 RepID=UPI002F225A9A
MARRGSESRQKTKPVLVRLTEADHRRLTMLAEREGTNRAEYLRRRIAEPAGTSASRPYTLPAFSEADRILLASATRSMGHLAGLLKVALLKTPAFGRTARLQSILDAHPDELQALQRQIRDLLERRG